MKKHIFLGIGLLLGFVLTFLLMRQIQENRISDHSHVIAYEIKRMNKMVVAEQNFSEIYSHKNSRSLPFIRDYFSFDKSVLLIVNAKVQATYDLNQLDIEIDDNNNKIIINSIPDLELQVYPDVQFYDVEQSRFNTFKKDELNQVKQNAIKEIEKKIDRNKLEQEAKEQLLQNLLDLYLLAKSYDWGIEDRTEFAEELEEMFR